MDADNMNNGVAAISLDRCTGCGSRVVTCESNAIQLKKKDAEQPPPKTMNDMYTKILMRKVSKLSMLKIGAKILLKLKV
jgi:Na+-translocating ferredoxin:NAD+ oxidoreductase RNF subunit RnfB